MDMLAYMNCLKNHSIKNPIAEAINSVLDQLNAVSLEGVGQYLKDSFNQAKQFLLDQVDTVGALMKKFLDGLPLLKASDSIFNKLKISQGIQPAADGGDGVKSILNNIYDMAGKAAQFAVNMGTKIQDVVSGVVTDIGAFIGDLSESVSAHVEAIGRNISEGLTVLSDTMANLKDYAMAKFTSSIQLPSMSELLNKLLPDECPIPSQAVIELDNKTAANVIEKKYEEAQLPRTPTTSKTLTEEAIVAPATNTEDIPAPIVNGKSITQLKSEFLHELNALGTKIMLTIVEMKVLESESMTYRNTKYPDYWDLYEKQNSGKNDDIFRFHRVRLQFTNSEVYLAWMNKKEEVDKLKAENTRLQKLWEKWQLEGFVNVTEGPW